MKRIISVFCLLAGRYLSQIAKRLSAGGVE